MAKKTQGILTRSEASWQERLDFVVDAMRAMSEVDDPREVVAVFGEKVASIFTRDASISLTRREVEPPKYIISRFSGWENPADPWTERHKLPLLEGGLIGELIYGNAPRIIDDLEVAADDPAAEYFKGMKSLIAFPAWDHGEALNMTIFMRKDRAGFDPDSLPEIVLVANLMGRAVHNLRLGDELQKAYDVIDDEMKVVSGLQLSLLPKALPKIPSVDVAVHYETAQRAGGDYYDFFELPDGKWGILVADVCGHGPAAAVLMAITHAIFHTYPKVADDPAVLLDYVNAQLTARYTYESKTFVTALYGVYDPKTREFVFARAGHDPGRVFHPDGTSTVLNSRGNLPLGVSNKEAHETSTYTFKPGDLVAFYTDGLTEAHNPDGALFGLERFDKAVASGTDSAESAISAVLEAVKGFTRGEKPHDDRSLLTLKFR